jgi:EAL domain-containing protein (putative c-di-GMP-specific phosphodiesterase class I)
MNDDLPRLYSMLALSVPRDSYPRLLKSTLAVANLEDAADFINEMRSTSRFSLDDFGVAVILFLPKALTRRLHQNDGALVRDITRSDVDFACASITEMGWPFRSNSIAEYVSAEDILRRSSP